MRTWGGANIKKNINKGKKPFIDKGLKKKKKHNVFFLYQEK